MTNKIELLAMELGLALSKHNWQCVTAESCTGGGLSYWITSVPGSSAWFERGFITYSNAAKQEIIGVSDQTLINFGSVSEATAREMAEGALRHSDAHISVAITGIAGPDGGTADKPVGTVWIATAIHQNETLAKKHVFCGDRRSIREQSIVAALEQLLLFL